MSTAKPEASDPTEIPQEWVLPSPRKTGMVCLFIIESALFVIFVVAYLFYMGKSLTGPYPAEVLEFPWIASAALFISSWTVLMGEKAFEKGHDSAFRIWWGITIFLGGYFTVFSFNEWYHLIYEKGLTISTNLFGSTFYSLVGLHLTHVIVALILLILCVTLSAMGKIPRNQSERIAMVSWYKHFVVAIWVVVLPVVYIISTRVP